MYLFILVDCSHQGLPICKDYLKNISCALHEDYSQLINEQSLVFVSWNSFFVSIEQPRHFLAIFGVPFINISVCWVLYVRQPHRFSPNIKALQRAQIAS